MTKFPFFKGDSSRIGLDVTPFNEGCFYLTSNDGLLYLDYKDSITGANKRILVNELKLDEINFLLHGMQETILEYQECSIEDIATIFE